MSAEPDAFLTVAEIASILKLNPQTVRNWIDAGRLPAHHLGRRVRVKREDFDALIESGQTRSAAPPAEPQAQAFWEGDYHPMPVLTLGESG